MAEEHNGCDCALCKRDREYQRHIATVPEPARAFFAQLYEDLNETEFENVRLAACQEGEAWEP